jgi:hypothetical protein
MEIELQMKLWRLYIAHVFKAKSSKSRKTLKISIPSTKITNGKTEEMTLSHCQTVTKERPQIDVSPHQHQITLLGQIAAQFNLWNVSSPYKESSQTYA